MGSDARLKRLGLDHLKDRPEELKRILRADVEQHRQEARADEIAQLEALLPMIDEPDRRKKIEARLGKLREEASH